MLLPGTIPRLVRVGSAIVGDNGDRGLVVDLTSHPVLGLGARAYHYGGMSASFVPFTKISLDLRDPTSRVHAAWWAWERWVALTFPQWAMLSGSNPMQVRLAIEAAQANKPMHDEEIAALRDFILRVAGEPP